MNKKLCYLCGEEIKDSEEYCKNGRYDEPTYQGEPVWHLECYNKEHEYARDKGTI